VHRPVPPLAAREEVSYDADEGLGAADYGRLVKRRRLMPDVDGAKQQLDHLRGAFGGLSETHHQILVMREFEGLSYREIGERLGMSRPSVESDLFRARKRLTEEYDELVTGARCVRIQASSRRPALGTGRRKLGARARPRRDRLLRARTSAHCQPSAAVSGAHAAQWSAQLSSMADPSVVAGWARAAAAAATIAVAGIGAGVATKLVHDSAAVAGTPAAAPALGHSAVAAPVVVRQAARSATAGRTGATIAQTVPRRGQTSIASAKPTRVPPASTASPASSAPAAPATPIKDLGAAAAGKILPPTAPWGSGSNALTGERRPVRDALRGIVSKARASVAPVVLEIRAAIDDARAGVDRIFHGG
jgi:hypothetical protein